jgi:predicted dehydrogenase
VSKLRIGVIGAGLIGRIHIELASRHADVALVGIADPAPEAEELAAKFRVPHFRDHRAMLDAVEPRGVIIATPNGKHAQIAIGCLERGVAVIVEKPIADNLIDAQRICDASAKSGLPALVGHQRRYNPIVRKAKAIIDAGTLGEPVSTTVMSKWLKPDDYFVPWRRQKGGGPILINLIHDIDLMRHLFGEIETVQAQASNRIRKFEVEDTAAVLLHFRNGALGTVSLTDTAVAPWNWDLAAGEAERFPRQDVNAHFYSGTEASLTLPRLELWRYREGRGWQDPLTMERSVVQTGDPYVEQLRHFAAAVAGTETPVCSALDGTRTLEATLAVSEAAATGDVVRLAGYGPDSGH